MNIQLWRRSAWAGATVLLGACQGEPGVAPDADTQSDPALPPVVLVTVTPTKAELLLNQTVQLTATLKDAAGRTVVGRPITWASDNPAVASVNSSGDVIGVGYGPAAVTATVEGVRGTAAIVVTALELATVDAGSYRTCGVSVRGSAYCWGYLPGLYDTLTLSSIPMPVAKDRTFASVTSGWDHYCGLDTLGAAFCWGDGGLFGGLGDGSTTRSTTPVSVAGGHAFSALSLSEFSSCGLAISGKAYCWGVNSFGELGDGSRDTRSVPVEVSGGLTFSTLSAEAFVTCGVTTAGTGYCWGWNSSGQLGTRSVGTGAYQYRGVEGSTTPVPVDGNLTLSGITLGYWHGCGLTTGGAAYCWGPNDFGQLGDGARVDSIYWNPAAVTGGLTFSALAAGGNHTCGLTPAGTAYCWGGNYYGQVGSPATPPGYLPSPVAVAGGLTFSDITVGLEHACGRTPGGTWYCWGLNYSGELGNGRRTDLPGCGLAADTRASPYCSVPVKVAGQP